jgi:hypothetical protein
MGGIDPPNDHPGVMEPDDVPVDENDSEEEDDDDADDPLEFE